MSYTVDPLHTIKNYKEKSGWHGYCFGTRPLVSFSRVTKICHKHRGKGEELWYLGSVKVSCLGQKQSLPLSTVVTFQNIEYLYRAGIDQSAQMSRHETQHWSPAEAQCGPRDNSLVARIMRRSYGILGNKPGRWSAALQGKVANSWSGCPSVYSSLQFHHYGNKQLVQMKTHLTGQGRLLQAQKNLNFLGGVFPYDQDKHCRQAFIHSFKIYL